MKARNMVLFALAALATSVGLWLRLSEEPPHSGHHEDHAQAVPFEASAGVYTLRYESKQAGPQGIQGSLKLRGQLELRHYARERLGLVLTSCEGIDWRVLERVVLGTGDDCNREVVGREVVLEFGEHRRLLAVQVPRELTPRAEHLLRGLAQELAFERRPLEAWSTLEQSPRGRVQARYAKQAQGLVRERERYVDLAQGTVQRGTSSIRFDDGELVAIAMHEQLSGTQVSLKLERKSAAAPRPPPSTENWARRTPSLDAAASREEHLRQRVEGLTPAELFGALDQFADGGRFPDHERFFWRASGLLKQQPGLAGQLERRFTQSAATHQRRALLLDLLASAGTPEAQASMRRMLETPAAAERSDRFAHYVQRLSILEKPDTESLRWIEARYRGASDDNQRLASAYALASVARQHGSDAERDAIANRLEHDLNQSHDERDRAHLMRALGATGSPGAEQTLREGLGSDSPNVRLAALDGLARLGVRQAVQSALADPNPEIQAAAIRRLSFDADDANALEPVIGTGQLPESTARSLVRLLARQANAEPESVRRLARALIEAGYASGAEAATLHALSSG